MNVAYFIDVHPDVRSYYDKAYHWYEMQQIGLGERFLHTVREKLDKIRSSPMSYGSKSNKAFREAKINDFPYLIVYRVYANENRIFINSIHHEKLHPSKKYRKYE